MKKIITLFLFVFSFTVYSQYDFHVADSVLASYNKPGSPGVTVLVSKDGKIIYQKSGGYANIAKGELITDNTLFNLASDSKQFTAACIVLLEQKGKLKLDDNLSKYFPDFPEYAQTITIQDLLNHTAGFVDYRTAFWIAGKEVEDMSNNEVRDMLKASSLNFTPRTSWSYSNSNYWCLVQIVEQVSGMSIAKFADKNIFKPLKMKNTYYERDVRKVKNAALGYELEDNKYTECNIDTGVFGGSGVFSTAGDMLKWQEDMQNKKVLGTAFWNTMLNGQKHLIAKDAYYSNGLFFQNFKDKKWIHHGGDLDGYHSDKSFFPEENLNILVFTNKGDFEDMNMQYAITSQLFGFKYSWPAEEKSEEVVEVVQVPKEILERYVGIYEAMGMHFEIAMSDTTIKATQLWDGTTDDLPATGENSFRLEDADFVFENVEGGKAQLMKITQEGETMGFKRTENYKGADYSAYTGRFRCESLNTQYDFYEKEGKLFYSVNGKEIDTVGLIQKDTTVIQRGKMVFERNSEGNVTGFILDHSRVKNLKFVKI